MLENKQQYQKINIELTQGIKIRFILFCVDNKFQGELPPLLLWTIYATATKNCIHAQLCRNHLEKNVAILIFLKPKTAFK